MGHRGRHTRMMGSGPLRSHFKPAWAPVATCGRSGSSKYRVVPVVAARACKRSSNPGQRAKSSIMGCKGPLRTWDMLQGRRLQDSHRHLRDASQAGAGRQNSSGSAASCYERRGVIVCIRCEVRGEGRAAATAAEGVAKGVGFCLVRSKLTATVSRSKGRSLR